MIKISRFENKQDKSYSLKEANRRVERRESTVVDGVRLVTVKTGPGSSLLCNSVQHLTYVHGL